MNTAVIQPPRLSNGRLMLLGVSSSILCMSGFMTLFAPFPLGLAIVLYGRLKAFLAGFVGLIISVAIAFRFFGDLTFVGLYVGVLVFAFGIGEIALRGLHPIKSLVALGLGFILTTTIAAGFFLRSQNIGLEQFILQQIEKNAGKIAERKTAIEKEKGALSIDELNLLDNPKLMVKEFMEVFPGYYFMWVFLTLWASLYLVLKSRRLLFSIQDYPYSERNLLNFKVPFGLVFVLIIGLALALAGDQYVPKEYEVWGFTIIKCLGLFYFFQGFGVFSDLLNFIGVFGFFRPIVMIFVISLASYLIAVVGLLDNWFDFRKYFIKRNTED